MGNSSRLEGSHDSLRLGHRIEGHLEGHHGSPIGLKDTYLRDAAAGGATSRDT